MEIWLSLAVLILLIVSIYGFSTIKEKNAKIQQYQEIIQKRNESLSELRDKSSAQQQSLDQARSELSKTRKALEDTEKETATIRDQLDDMSLALLNRAKSQFAYLRWERYASLVWPFQMRNA